MFISLSQADLGDILGRIAAVPLNSARNLTRAGRTRLLIFCAAWALALAAAPPAALAVAATETSDSPTVQEIVVTATRQETPLSKAPLSVTAFSAERMQALDIKTLSDVARVTPGLKWDPDLQTVSIRGVGSNSGAGAVGIYIDDTPIQIRAIGDLPTNTVPTVFDLERVEVLRGPQGTLFGAGAEGGAIRYITRQPDLTQTRGYFRSEISSTQGGEASGEAGAALSVPLVQDHLAARASYWFRRDGGWVDRVDYHTGAVTDANANRTDTAVVRAALAWTPIEGLLITPAVNAQSRRAGDTDGWWEGLSDPSRGAYRNGNPVRLTDDDRFVLPSLKVEYTLPGAKLIANTAYFFRKQSTFYDASIYNLSWMQQSTPAPLLTATGPDLPIASYVAPGSIINRQNDFTQEVRLQSDDPDARVTWIVGAFYGWTRQRNSEAIIDPQFDELNLAVFGQTGMDLYGYGLLPGDRSYIGEYTSHDSQIAAYSEMSWRFAPRWRLTAGVRVARTRFDFTNFQDGPYNAPGPSGASGAETETPVTPKLGVSYEPDDRSLVYATAQKGYRIGGANVPLPLAFCKAGLDKLGLSASPDKFGSDSVWSYELGGKTSAFGRRLTVAASVYYLNWSDIQESVYLPECGFAFTTNAGSAVSRGFDLQGQARVGRGVSLDWAVGYDDAAYSTNTRASAAPGAPVIAAKGDALPGSPWSVALGLNWSFQAAGRDGFLRADYQYSSHSRASPMQDPATQAYDPAIPSAPATSYVQLRAGVDMGGWRLQGFVDNLLNARPELTRTHEDQATALFIGTTFRPRTAGISIDRSF